MSDNLKLGQIIEPGRQADRDAIHVAVAPVVAAHKMFAGNHVGLVDGLASVYADKLIGIVDPFLGGPDPKFGESSVKNGERFWLYLYPGSITSLRHDWTHPEFSGPPSTVSIVRNYNVETSRAWLEDFARQQNVSYEELIAGVDGGSASWGGTYWSSGFVVDDIFWDHYEVATGRTADRHTTYFSCSC